MTMWEEVRIHLFQICSIMTLIGHEKNVWDCLQETEILVSLLKVVGVISEILATKRVSVELHIETPAQDS